MIKFFRKIRRRLLSESKFTKYLIYAIGEIVLVVIGILIALSINNWNQGRLDADKETAYLSNIVTDLEQQLTYIDLQLEQEHFYGTTSKMMLDRYRKDGVLVIDSATSSQLLELTVRKTFTKADPTFRDLISTGNMGLIQDESLRNELISYYMELERIEKIMLNNNFLYVDEMFAGKMVEKVYLVGGQIITATEQRFFEASNQLMQHPEHEMVVISLIDIRRSIAEGHIQFMDELREKTESILRSIENKNSAAK